jgi:Fic family protein
MNPLANALELLQTLNALRPISEIQERRIWQKFRLDWNFHSNHLEGNSLTYGETKSLLLHNITAQGKPLKDHLEITGHNEALLEIQEAIKQQRPITESFLRQLHTLILKERYQVDAQTAEGQPTRKWVEVGQYKTQPNHVITATGETFRFAEPFEVAAKMEKLVQETNAECDTPEAALLLAAKLHYQFVLIHPFDDGNGRMARILMNLVLMRCGFPPAIIKTQEKEAYFSALRQADGGQFEVFAEYIAERVAESLKIMVAGAKGESIEEPDDLDKKIALFLGLAKEKGGTLPVAKTEAIFVQFCDTVVLEIIRRLAQKTLKLSQLYAQVEEHIADSSGMHLISFQQTLTDKFIPTSVFAARSYCSLQQQFNYLAVTKGEDSYYWEIEFNFNMYEVCATFNGNDELVVTTYNAQNFEQFIQKIIEVSVNAHLNWLQKTTGMQFAA